jgi:S-adenosylmethionine:tRNA ribosyltransferase-isomerase
MIPANSPVQRPSEAKLLVVDADGKITHTVRNSFIEYLRAGDLVIANDAATLPASLTGIHSATGRTIEVRLASRRSLDSRDVNNFTAIIFGEGDFRQCTEQRPAPPALAIGDHLQLGPLSARIAQLLDHPRLVRLHFQGEPDTIWAGLARHGRPIQYSYMETPLQTYDVWTRIAAQPVAFEPPSAGFALDWQTVSEMRARNIEFATITHAAGISSTGDAELDRRLPFDEPYAIPAATVRAIVAAKSRGARVIAIGTTVVRALEDAAAQHGFIVAGAGLATSRIGPTTRLQVVDAILSGTHEPDTSHYQLLRAFLDDELLKKSSHEIERQAYRTHEFGDSVLIHSCHT